MFDLRTARLEPGDHQRRALEVSIPPVILGGLTYRVEPDPAPADLELTRLTNGLVLQLRLDVDVHGTCHRCLGDAKVHVAAREREFQADRPEAGAEEEMTSEYVDMHEHTVDVDRWASDAVVLALPQTIVCREDCKGLCPTCGHDLNEGPCDCPPPPPDERWAALRDLIPPEE